MLYSSHRTMIIYFLKQKMQLLKLSSVVVNNGVKLYNTPLCVQYHLAVIYFAGIIKNW